MFTHHQSEPSPPETEQQLLFSQCLSALCALPDSISRRTALSLSIEYRNQQADRFTDLFDRYAPERGENMERLLEVVRRATDLDEVNFLRLACEVKEDRGVNGKNDVTKGNGRSRERNIRDEVVSTTSVEVSASIAVDDIEDEGIVRGLGNDDRQVEQHDQRDQYERDIKHQDCRNVGESEKEMFSVEEEPKNSEKAKEIIVVVPENVVPSTGEDGPTVSNPDSDESNVVNYGVSNGKKVDETSTEFPSELENSNQTTKEIRVLKKKKRSTKKRNADITVQIGSEESMVQGVKEEWKVEPVAGGEPKDILFPIHMTPKTRIISKVDTVSIGQEMTEPADSMREGCPFAGRQQGTGKEDGRLGSREPDIADANFRELRNSEGSGKDLVAVEEPEKVEGMAKVEEAIAIVLRNLVSPKVDPSTNSTCLYHPKADEPEFVSTNVAGHVPDVLKEKKDYVIPTQFCAASQDMHRKKKKKKKRGNKKKHTDLKVPIASDDIVAETVTNEEEVTSEPVASAEPKDVEGFSIPIHMIPTISIVSGLDILSIVQNTRTALADSVQEGERSARKQHGKTATLVRKYGKDDDRFESINQWESDIADFNCHEPHQNFGETATDAVAVEGPELAEDMEKVEEAIALVLANFVPSKDEGGLLSSETEVVSTNVAGEIPKLCEGQEEVVIPIKICTRSENNSQKKKKKKNNRKKSRKKNTDSKVPGFEVGGTGSKDESLVEAVENPEPNDTSSPMNMTTHDIKMDSEDSMQEGDSSARQLKSTTTSFGHEVETPVILEKEPPIPQNRTSGPFTTTCSRLYPSVISCSCPGHRNIPATEQDQIPSTSSSLNINARASPSHSDRIAILESKQDIWQKTADLSPVGNTIFGNELIENFVPRRSIALPKELSDPAIICTGSFRNYPKFALGSNNDNRITEEQKKRSATPSFGIPISIKDLVRSSGPPRLYPEGPTIPNRNGQSPPPKFGSNQTVPVQQTQSNAHARRQGDVAPEISGWNPDPALAPSVVHRNGGSRSRSNYKNVSLPNRRYDKPSGLNTEELRSFLKDRWHKALSRAVGYPGTGAPREIVLYHDEFD